MAGGEFERLEQGQLSGGDVLVQLARFWVYPIEWPFSCDRPLDCVPCAATAPVVEDGNTHLTDFDHVPIAIVIAAHLVGLVQPQDFLGPIEQFPECPLL